MLATKFSTLMLYARIFSTPYFRIIIKIATMVCGAWFFASLMPTILQCDPVEGTWKPTSETHCISRYTLFQSITIANFLTDLIVVWLPVHVIWTLRLDAKKRLAIIGMFGMGTTVCLCSFLRLIMSSKLSASYEGKYRPPRRSTRMRSLLIFSPQQVP